MALAFTVTSLQAELEAFRSELEARDWAGAADALNRYTLTWAGLVESGSVDGLSLKLPSPEALANLIDRTRMLVAKTTMGRFAVQRTNFNESARW